MHSVFQVILQPVSSNTSPSSSWDYGCTPLHLANWHLLIVEIRYCILEEEGDLWERRGTGEGNREGEYNQSTLCLSMKMP